MQQRRNLQVSVVQPLVPGALLRLQHQLAHALTEALPLAHRVMPLHRAPAELLGRFEALSV